tara:strand:- start:3701 stop:8206 length:4506 start_codon:yes stop_codon:yes gene_type:complete
MAIDKIKLRSLAKDKDERFFAEGDMLDAKNITVSTSEETSGGVVKNTKGTVPGSAATTSDQIPNQRARVIGSVSDDANGKVYFFVWSTSSSVHGVYEYDVSNDSYKVLIRSTVLDFDEYGFVKADIVSGHFRREESLETMIYFTDGKNNPRKINVQQALEHRFQGFSNQEIEHSLAVVKAPSLLPPTVELKTDTSRKTNNLYGTVFQFAVQYVYTNGEKSALSPHSEVVYPKYMSLQGIESQDANLLGSATEENKAEINTRWVNQPSTVSYNKADVKEIVILARTVNTNPFFVVDTFDPNQDLVKNGSTVYGSASGIYSFYNDGLYLYESSSVTDRVFDDVPHKAVGQSVSGGRLMYSSPTSGYENTNVQGTLAVNYEETPSGVFVSDSESNPSITHGNTALTTNIYDGSFELDVSSVPPTVTAKSRLSVSFTYKPTGFKQYGFYGSSGIGGVDVDNSILDLSFTKADGTSITLSGGKADDSAGSDFLGSLSMSVLDGNDGANVNSKVFSASVVIDEETTRAFACGKLVQALEDEIATYTYSIPKTLGNAPILWQLKDSSNAKYPLYMRRVKFDLNFDCAFLSSSDTIKCIPRVGNWDLPVGSNAFTSSGPILFSVGAFVLSDADFYIDFDLTDSDALGDPATSLDTVVQSSFFTSSATAPANRNGIFTSGTPETWENYNLGDNVSPQDNGASAFNLLISQSFKRRTFKAGSTHKFGVVYFDEFGRCGNVNEIGDTYVLPFGDPGRLSKNGPCTISVTITSDPPSWAVSYQIVYSDMGSWEKFESFVVGGGIYKKTDRGDAIGGGTGTAETPRYKSQTDAIYVSINTLSRYQFEKGAIKDYVYTPGDKLRIISYKDTTTNAPTFYTSSDADIHDVAGIEVFTSNINPEYTDTFVQTNRVGKFLKVIPPGGQAVTNFDPGGTNFWDNECLVEILTPRKDPPTEIFYEIGASILLESPRDGANRHGDAVSLTEGSVYYGTRSVITPNVYDDGDGNPMTSFSDTNIEDFDYDTREMESMDASDFVASRCWSKGRAHVKYDQAKTKTLENRIVYSEEQVDPLGDTKFSSFNPGSNSFKDLPANYGSINYINEYNQGLVAIQENKLSYIPVKRNIIEYADGSSAITANASVLGTHKEANGDFGIGSDQSSALVRDGMVFFVDKSRQKSIMASGANMISISDIEMSSFLETEINNMEAATGSGGRIISGYNPDENLYLLTIEPKVSGPSTTYAGITIGYSISDKRWISRYDFKPSNYCFIDNKLLSGFWYQNADDTQSYLFNNHKSTTMNTFYGTAYPSSVKVISKISPSRVKVFNAISYEGESSEWEMSTGATTNLNQTSGVIHDAADIVNTPKFVEKEGGYYAAMSKSSALKYYYIGTISDGGVTPGSNNINLSDISRLDRLNFFTSEVSLFTSSDGQTFTQDDLGASVLISFNLSTKSITITPNPNTNIANGKKLYAGVETNGDALRGNFAKITLTNSSTTKHELYCINTHITDSKLHHPLGQQ